MPRKPGMLALGPLPPRLLRQPGPTCWPDMAGDTEMPAPKQAPRRSAKTVVSLMYVYGGRAAGLLWTVALIHQLSISDYGLYSLGFALTSILGQTLNNPY